MIPIDKMLHFGAGWIISSTVLVLFIGSPYAVAFSIALAALAGLCKEIWDKMGNGTPDVKDFAVTVLGGVTVNILFVVGGMLNA